MKKDIETPFWIDFGQQTDHFSEAKLDQKKQPGPKIISPLGLDYIKQSPSPTNVLPQIPNPPSGKQDPKNLTHTTRG